MPRYYETDTEKLKVYQGRVHSAEHHFKRWSKDADRWVKRYRNEASEMEITVQGHRVSTPTGIANIDAMFSSLTAVEIAVAINPMGHGDREQARIAERAIDEVWAEQRINQKSEYAIKDALLVGIGWLKIGYDYAERTETRTREQDEIDNDVNAVYDQAAAEGIDPPNPLEVAAVVPLEEEVTIVERDRVTIDYVPWDTLWWDPSARRPEDIRWLVEVAELTPAEVTQNEVYREYVTEQGGKLKDLEDLKPDTVLDKEYRGDRDATEDDDRITVYRHYDLDNGTLCEFAKSGKFVLNEQPIPLAFNDDLPDRSPFVPLVLRSNPDSVRGISDMELMEPSLNELAFYRSNLANFLERVKGKVVGPADALGEAGKAALQSQDIVAYVPLEQGHDKSEIDVLQPPSMPQEMFAMEQRIENHIREATGVSELMRGLFPDRKRTATETSEVVAASSARQAEKRNKLEQFYTDVARRILAYIMLFYDETRIARLVDDPGDTLWEWTAEDITMEADLRVELASKEPKNFQTRKDEAFLIFNTLMTFAGPDQNSWVDGPMALKKALKLLDWADEDIREVLNLPEEQQVAQQQALQDQANQAVAEEGVPPPPDAVPGPLSSPELAAAANGEIPPEAIPPEIDAALARGGYGDSPLNFLPGP